MGPEATERDVGLDVALGMGPEATERGVGESAHLGTNEGM